MDSEGAPKPSPELEEQARRDLGPDPFRELDAGVPPPTVPNPKPSPIAAPAPDPRVDDEAAIRATLASVDCARIHDAIIAHGGASPAVVREALTAAERCEEKSKDLAAAKQTARSMLLACGPESVERCRSKALGLMKKLAKEKPADRALEAKAKDVADKDSCLQRAEQSVNKDAPLDACLGAADATYRGLGDDLMRARVRLARARHAAHKDEATAEKLFGEAVELCKSSRCSGHRIRALEHFVGWAQAKNRPDLVLQLRLQQDAIAADALPPDRRAYSRSAKVDAACTALEAAQGPGSCRALEKRVAGHWTFHDWSATEAPGDLPKEQIIRANDDFAPTLQDCFRDQAARLPVPSTVSYRVRWMVTSEGRADQVHLDAPADDSGPLAQCLRQRFSLWRYPRSRGENQHVEQGFTISAKPR